MTPSSRRRDFIGESFVERFGAQTFTIPDRSDYVELFIRRSMTDREILAELKPEICTLGNLFNLLHRSGQWPWSLCYICDRSTDLRVIHFWREDGEWSIDDGQTGTWNEMLRVYGPERRPF